MITKRTAVLVVVLGALAAWLAAAATSAVRPSVHQNVSTPPAIDVRGAALSAEIERLHDRLHPTAAPEHARNLFQFGRTRPAASAPPAVDVSAAIQAAPAAPVELPFKLIGVAEDNGARTAILTLASQLLMLHNGEAVTAGAFTYHVTGISADAVELTSTADGAVLRLALK
jgi:hypothetical protein